MNPAAALLAYIALAKRADSKTQWMDHLEWSRPGQCNWHCQALVSPDAELESDTVVENW
jgi:hypothetical protein